MFVVKVHSLDKCFGHLFHRGVRAEIAAELVHRHPHIFHLIALDFGHQLQRFIARINAELDEVTATRSKVRNKQRNCTDPERMAELKKQCAACTTVLADLRKKKKTACDIIEDHPRLRELLESELEARLENDPYLSEREKGALRQQTASMREEKQYER